MYVGYAYAKAGIRKEILRSLVFWSGYRLHLFFTKGEDVRRRKIGSFWQPHTTLRLDFSNDERRKEAFDAFSPEPGDVVLFRKDYGHVAIVDSMIPRPGPCKFLKATAETGYKLQPLALVTIRSRSSVGSMTLILATMLTRDCCKNPRQMWTMTMNAMGKSAGTA